MAILSSESDTSTLARRRDALCHSIFFSLTTDMNHVFRNWRVPTAQLYISYAPGVRVHYYFYLLTGCCLLISFCLQLMATLKEADHWQMWGTLLFRIIKGKSNFKRASLFFCGSVARYDSVWIIFFSHMRRSYRWVTLTLYLSSPGCFILMEAWPRPSFFLSNIKTK